MKEQEAIVWLWFRRDFVQQGTEGKFVWRLKRSWVGTSENPWSTTPIDAANDYITKSTVSFRAPEHMEKVVL